MLRRNPRRPARLPAALFATLLLSSACAHRHDFTWVDELAPAPAKAPEILIGVGDALNVRVFNQDQLSSRARVRDDGKITLPLIHEVDAAGLTPQALAAAVQARFRELVKNAVVTVSIEERKPSTVLVTGEVAKPGIYVIDGETGVLRALLSAGGLGPDASDDQIFVIRRGVPSRIRFKYESLLEPSGKAVTFKLEGDDVVVVE